MEEEGPLKRFAIAAAVAILVAAVADAQYKTPAQTQTGPGTIKIDAPGARASTRTVEEEMASAKRIARADAIKMVKADKAVYIDVRSKESYDEGHLPGAISIPLSELPGRFRDLPIRKYLITYCA